MSAASRWRRWKSRLAVFCLLGGALASGAVSAACQSDSDCKPGLRCLFARERPAGVCASTAPSLEPITSKATAMVPLHQRGGTGFPCQFTQDCLPRHACYKLGARLEGQCFR
ncbi:MAG: hypothetical protein V9G63_07840 [Candidatus Competibacter sp.]